MNATKNYNVKRLSGNLFELQGQGEYAGVTVLVSYETPVAYMNPIANTVERTSTRFSRSTESQLSRWAAYTGTIAQSALDELLRDMTGDTRFSEKQSTAAKLGRTHNTRGVSGHTEPGDKNLVVPIKRWQ